MRTRAASSGGPHPPTPRLPHARQTGDLGTGLRFLPIEHSANSSSSSEEARAISRILDDLLGIEITDLTGATRHLTADDVMVVAPHNAQVRLLRRRLGPKVAVGTVNAFQGQEAPVVFFSMANSTAEDMPRDVSFLFSRERLNVAISRARCLAYLVLNPALLEAPARDLEQMKLINTLCAAVDYAKPVSTSPQGLSARRPSAAPKGCASDAAAPPIGRSTP